MGKSRALILDVMRDGVPWSSRDIVKATGLSSPSVYGALKRCWISGLVLRTQKPIFSSEKVFRGRAGIRIINRPYHLFLYSPSDGGSRVVEGHRFFEYDDKYLDPRGGGGRSKAQIIFDFLVENADRAWYSVDIVEALKEEGVRIADIMANVRRWEKKRLVYVRGYKTDEGQTPFRRGYLITYLDREKSNDDARAFYQTSLSNRNAFPPIIFEISWSE